MHPQIAPEWSGHRSIDKLLAVNAGGTLVSAIFVSGNLMVLKASVWLTGWQIVVLVMSRGKCASIVQSLDGTALVTSGGFPFLKRFIDFTYVSGISKPQNVKSADELLQHTIRTMPILDDGGETHTQRTSS